MSARALSPGRRGMLALGAAAFVLFLFVAPVWGFLGIGDTSDITLVQILTQMIHATKTLDEMSSAASQTAHMTRDILSTYQRVNAGIDELSRYPFGAFLQDLQTDFYNQYPGFGELEYASRNLSKWVNTRTRSPFTAYEAITAVVADVTEPLRTDLHAGRANIDQELVLAGEASGGFAAAHSAEQATKTFDEEIQGLATAAQSASPGQAEQIQARATVMLVAQQSHLMRLLSRTVRLESVNAALAYGSRIEGKNAGYASRDATIGFAKEAMSPPPLIHFSDEEE